MRLLDRYLLRELLIPLGFCLGFFLLLWIAFDLISQLSSFQSHKLHAGDVLEYYVVAAPEFLVQALPMALLLALLYALTNHARHHEITAIRAAGISLLRLCLPYFAVGLGLSLCLFVLNELWVPSSVGKAEQILNRRTDKPADDPAKQIYHNLGFQNSRDGRTWQIYQYDARTHQMLQPKVNWTTHTGISLWVMAERAEWLTNMWIFYDVKEYQTSSGPNGETVPILQTAVLPMPEFLESPELIAREIKFNERLARHSTHSAELSITEILEYFDLHPDLTPRNRSWLFTQFHERLAMPWTCLVVVLIAIPFGAGSGRRNVFVGVAGSIVICFAFFILQRLGLALGTGGYMPAWLAAWLPNLTFAAAGFLLMLQVR